MSRFEKLLSGDDLRSTGKSDSIVLRIQNQKDFDELFKFLFHEDRIVVMRAADAIEKITIVNPEYLKKHKKAILALSGTAQDKELKWHLALLISRLELNNKELGIAWNRLTAWAKDKTNSRIVRVNSIQGLFDLLKFKKSLQKDFDLTLLELYEEDIPSIKARIRILKAKKSREELQKKAKRLNSRISGSSPL